MTETEIFEEIINLGKQRGVLTYDEINEALPSEFFPPDKVEDLMDVLNDVGVKVVDCEESILDEEQVEEHERAEDLVYSYFNSMGNISVLARHEEIDLAKKLEQGRDMTTEIISTLPIFDKIKTRSISRMKKALQQKKKKPMRHL